jgi:hypothetical protein
MPAGRIAFYPGAAIVKTGYCAALMGTGAGERCKRGYLITAGYPDKDHTTADLIIPGVE